ncbi:hypothetical protein EGT67_17725 [Prescottella agglutinans]|uniref:Uncharacterized protein n=1 Tax=Prescottella agglutinans TaxID=1644129 RepID=A0A3S3BSK3_9NOCA|nr:hypothetical protein [Prescottella agglutinans]RVW08242.1 hypothetical protein EGT67_17725 [Prescottella agglutinans]
MESASWKQLGDAVGAGELYLEPGTARRCADRCDELVARLKDIHYESAWLAKVDGFGDQLPSGRALAAKFERKASGGEYSLDHAIADHIAVVEQMRDAFLQIEDRYNAAEEANTVATTAVGSQIN